MSFDDLVRLRSPAEAPAPAEEELFEACVLFTDVRGSSDLITRSAPRDFFKALNRCLSAQAACIRRYEGAVVKYTGDGVMAVFRDGEQARLALECALELSRSAAQRIMPFGIGIAQGLVLAGYVGDAEAAGQRRQYDIIGATVHLAARLCDMAGAAEVIATHGVHATSCIDAPPPRFAGRYVVRGFEHPVECVGLKAAGPQDTSPST